MSRSEVVSVKPVDASHQVVGVRSGAVEEVDPPGMPAGVVVRFDRPFMGGETCFATHDQLRLSFFSAERAAALAVAQDNVDRAFGRKR